MERVTHGTIRVKTGFLWLPKTAYNKDFVEETRWLVCARLVEEFLYFREAAGKWVSQKWLD